MRLHVFHPASRLAVLRAMCRMPEHARRVAVESTIVGVGAASNGMSFPPGEVNGASLVVVAERDGVLDTFAHEVAHCYLGHSRGGEQAEREAAALAREWGFRNDAADPEVAASLVQEFITSAPEMRAVTGQDSAVRIECRCGSVCRVYAPTVIGMVAEIGIECPTCRWVVVEPLRELVRCPDCGARASVVWAPEATPTSPVARLVCSCGTSLSLRIHQCEPDDVEPGPPREPEDEAAREARQVARRLASITEKLRGLAPAVLAWVPRWAGDMEPYGVELESVRSALVWTRELLLKGVRSLDADDPRGEVVTDVDAVLAWAAESVVRRNLAAAVEALTDAAGLIAMMVPPEPTAAVEARSPSDAGEESNP